MQLPYAIKNRLPTITRVMRINKKMENEKECFIRIIYLSSLCKNWRSISLLSLETSEIKADNSSWLSSMDTVFPLNKPLNSNASHNEVKPTCYHQDEH